MKFWFLLPDHFKRSVIKKLDYKTRCRLRKCSKLDKELVDSCPVTLNQVNFEPRLGNQVYFSIEENEGVGKLFYDKCGTIQEVLQDFLLIFKNPKSEILKLTIAHFNFQRQPEAVNEFVASLFSEMESEYSTEFKLKIEKFSFHWGEIRDKYLLEFLKKLNPKTFKSIFLRKFPIKNPEMLEELVETEQWKNLKEIRIQEKLTIPFKDLRAVHVLNVLVYNLNAEDAWNYIKKYQSTPIPHQSYFLIFTTQEVPLTEILGLIDVPMKNESFSSQNHAKHTQRFVLPWSRDCILIVKFGMRRIKGTICRKGFEEEDFDTLEVNQLQEVV